MVIAVMSSAMSSYAGGRAEPEVVVTHPNREKPVVQATRATVVLLLLASAALVLMFAFLVLSTTPGFEIKSLAIGLAAGIIFDATVIRALLVPALMRLLGEANWWLPAWMATLLRIPPDEPAGATAGRRLEAAR